MTAVELGRKEKEKRADRYLNAAIGFLILIFIGVGIYLWTKTEKFNVYTDSNYGFKIKYPQSWIKKAAEEGSVVSFVSPQEREADLFQENVNITVQDLSAHPMILKEFTTLAIKQLTGMFNNVEILESQSALLSNKVGHKIVYLAKVEYNLEIKIMQTWVISPPNAYILTYSADNDHFADYKATVDKMFNSFILK